MARCSQEFENWREQTVVLIDASSSMFTKFVSVTVRGSHLGDETQAP
jgi:hypothetical protein